MQTRYNRAIDETLAHQTCVSQAKYEADLQASRNYVGNLKRQYYLMGFTEGKQVAHFAIKDIILRLHLDKISEEQILTAIVPNQYTL